MSFASDLQQYAKKTSRSMEELAMEVTIRWFASVVTGTPVDTGRARGNWLPSEGSARPGTTDRSDVGGAAVIAEVNETVKGLGIHYLANNLPYIRELEYGYSAQAPAGMVRLNLARLRSFYAKKVREKSK